jgi:L-aminopeptidase/D-esterase-like protein
MWPNDRMQGLFEATVGATEEAVVNALVAGRTMVGYKGRRVAGLPHDEVQAILRRHGRLVTR